MIRSKLALSLLALALAALAIPALSLAGAGTVQVGATLKGKNEVPGPGDPNGKGAVSLKLKPARKKLCFTLEVAKLDKITAGHIHKGDSKTDGPIKVTLFEDESGIAGDGSYEGCVKNVRKKLLTKVGERPEKYYVNLHTKKFPNGAVRGQLEPIVRAQ